VAMPSAPVRLGVYYSWGDAQDVCLKGRYAYLAGSGLEILDLSDPTAPVCVARGLNGTALNRVCLAGRYAFAIDSAGVEIVDVSNPTEPVVAGHYDAPEASDLALDGDTIYLAQGSYGLTILRIRLASRLNLSVVTGHGVHLSWPGTPGVRLQTSPTLNPAQWQDVPASEGASQLDLPLNSAAGFFRLSQP